MIHRRGGPSGEDQDPRDERDDSADHQPGPGRGGTKRKTRGKPQGTNGQEAGREQQCQERRRQQRVEESKNTGQRIGETDDQPGKERSRPAHLKGIGHLQDAGDEHGRPHIVDRGHGRENNVRESENAEHADGKPEGQEPAPFLPQDQEFLRRKGAENRGNHRGLLSRCRGSVARIRRFGRRGKFRIE